MADYNSAYSGTQIDQAIGRALPGGALDQNLGAHNVSNDAHNDLRLALQELSARVQDVLDSDDATLDELHEIVAYIKSNKTLIDAVTASKVSVSDIVNNLSTNVSNKPLSAAQGVILKNALDNAENTAEAARFDASEALEELANLTPESIGAAPDDLITECFSPASVAAFESYILSSFEAMPGGSVKHIAAQNPGVSFPPINGGSAILSLYKPYPQASTKYGVVEVRSFSAGMICRYFIDNGVLQEAEYISPPMKVGVEYRTTELWDGKPVYCKLMNLGTGPASGGKWTQIGISALQVRRMEISAYHNSERYALFDNSSAMFYAYCSASEIGIYPSSTSNLSVYTFYAKIYYTKA